MNEPIDQLVGRRPDSALPESVSALVVNELGIESVQTRVGFAVDEREASRVALILGSSLQKSVRSIEFRLVLEDEPAQVQIVDKPRAQGGIPDYGGPGMELLVVGIRIGISGCREGLRHVLDLVVCIAVVVQ
jgi:hypothetical protein